MTGTGCVLQWHKNPNGIDYSWFRGNKNKAVQIHSQMQSKHWSEHHTVEGGHKQEQGPLQDLGTRTHRHDWMDSFPPPFYLHYLSAYYRTRQSLFFLKVLNITLKSLNYYLSLRIIINRAYFCKIFLFIHSSTFISTYNCFKNEITVWSSTLYHYNMPWVSLWQHTSIYLLCTTSQFSFHCKHHTSICF